MKKHLCFILLLCILSALSAQLLDELENKESKEIKNDIIQVKHEKKSARKAMLMSAIFPGAGQFYVNKKNTFAYVFPVIEIAIISGMVYYDQQGDQMEKDYKKYANQHYDRARQTMVQNDMINLYEDGLVYTTTHFRLDADNTQHFYEDIAKYNKYIFGWDDWFDRYVVNNSGSLTIKWAVSTDHKLWFGNQPIINPNPDDPNYYEVPFSQNRQSYIKMRQDAEKEYDKSNTMMYLMLGNHFISSLDAVRVTKKYNKNYISSIEINGNLYSTIRDEKLTPFYQLSLKF